MIDVLFITSTWIDSTSTKDCFLVAFIRYICTSACQMHLHICIFFLCLCVYLRFPWYKANRQMKQELFTSNAHRVIGVVTHNGFAVHSIGTNILNKDRWTYNKRKERTKKLNQNKRLDFQWEIKITAIVL